MAGGCAAHAARIAFVVSTAILLAAAASIAAAPSRRPNIVLITIDALRPDHLGAYGYARPTSPSIDAFAREAVVISDAVAQAPYTKASVASLVSGLFPTANKAYITVASPDSLKPGEVPYTDTVVPEIQTLAEILKAAGYETLAFVTNPVLKPEVGFAQGFDEYTYFRGSPPQAYDGAATVLPVALRALGTARTRPFFLWVHLMDTHQPYRPPEPFRSMLPPLRPPRLVDLARIPRELRIERSRDLHLYEARYDGGIRTADAAVGEFFAALRARRLWDDTVVVLTADHGEEFMEHGGMGHNTTLYDELLRVPLIVKAPGLSPRRATQQAQLVDLYPTLARIAGAKQPRDLHGADLLPALQGRAPGEEFAFAEIVARKFAIRTLKWKYISSLEGTNELFDLHADPREQRNLAPRESARVARLENVLARVVAMAIKSGEKIQGRAMPMDPALLQRLRSLGYLPGD